MKYIGIADNHDSGAALFDDNKLISAVNEERFNRVKLSREFPILSLKYILKDIKPDEDIKVIVASEMTPSFLLRAFDKEYAKIRRPSQFSYLLNLYFLYQIFAKNTGLSNIEKLLSKYYLKAKIKRSLNRNIKLELEIVDHHTCHAYSAYSFSGMDKAIVVTADAMGDGISLTVSIGKKGKLRKLYEESAFSSISVYYSRITEYLGYVPLRHEGKIAGLAAYGNSEKTKNVLKKSLRYEGNGRFNRVNHLFMTSKKKLSAELCRFSKEDIASGLQENLEEELVKFISYWMKKTKAQNICLAGGLFSNVKLNQKIHEISMVRNIFIFPHMGDGGLATGGVASVFMSKPKKIDNLYLGPEYDDKEIIKVLDAFRLRYKKPANLPKEIAGLLANFKTVARFSGRMEYGPRALGNRSILFRPDDKSINDWLNRKLKRTEFMPFAPSVLKEDAKKCFKKIEGALNTARFMTITFECTRWMKKNCPGVVHVDGTARPQLVSKEENGDYYNLIKEFKKLTGLPCIINTSFNMHEEPIVCTPADAVNSFLSAKLDCLAIGSYLVLQKHKK